MTHRSEVPAKPSTVKAWIITIVSACVVAIVGTFTYRLGAAYNIPYGLFLSLLMVGMSSFMGAVRGSVWHVFVHGLVSISIVWAMALSSTSTSTVVALGGSSLITYWSKNCSLYWLYGIIVIHLIIMFIPQQWVNAFKD
ncbi:hypothetical protein [Alloscardovia omnicolens]|uniref:hypothetical protein n=1 Tax=Alloscardovia omnicolens TaxID=419015 RepID=UPI003A6DB417